MEKYRCKNCNYLFESVVPGQKKYALIVKKRGKKRD